MQGVPRPRSPVTRSHCRGLPETLLHHHSLPGGMGSRPVTWVEKSNGKPSDFCVHPQQLKIPVAPKV